MRDSVSLDLKLSYSENGRRIGPVEAATDLWHFAQRDSTEKRVSRNPYIALSCGIFPSKKFCDLQARRAPSITCLKVSAGDSVDKHLFIPTCILDIIPPAMNSKASNGKFAVCRSDITKSYDARRSIFLFTLHQFGTTK